MKYLEALDIFCEKLRYQLSIAGAVISFEKKMHELIFRYSLHCHQNYSNKKFLQRNMPNYTPEIPVKPRPFIKLQKHTFCFRKWQW